MRIVLTVLCFLGFCVGQEKKPASVLLPGSASAAPPNIIMSEPTFPFTSDYRLKFRDLQYENDQLEIENTNLLLKIEQNKAKQRDIVDRMRTVAFEFATEKKIDINLNQVDPIGVRFTKKPNKAQ